MLYTIFWYLYTTPTMDILPIDIALVANCIANSSQKRLSIVVSVIHLPVKRILCMHCLLLARQSINVGMSCTFERNLVYSVTEFFKDITNAHKHCCVKHFECGFVTHPL